MQTQKAAAGVHLAAAVARGGELVAEVARLREALERIAAGEVMGAPGTWTHADTVQAYQRIASKALAGGGS